jgi:hypothetical protein
VTEKYLPRPTVTITVNLPIDVAAALLRYADDNDRPIASVISGALMDVLTLTGSPR